MEMVLLMGMFPRNSVAIHPSLPRTVLADTCGPGVIVNSTKDHSPKIPIWPVNDMFTPPMMWTVRSTGIAQLR